MAAVPSAFHSLVDTSPDIFSLINKHGEIMYGSASTTALLGYKPDELVGRDCLKFIHPDDQAESSRALADVISTFPGCCRWDLRIRHKDGSYHWVESTASNLLQDLEVQAIVMQQRYIHNERLAAQTSEIEAMELVKSNLRLKEFAYTIAHDLREPLRAISVYTQLLWKKTSIEVNDQQMADFVIGGVGRMSAIISDLLSFAISGTHERSFAVDLQETAHLALQNLALEIEESGAIVQVDGLPVVYANPSDMIRLFQNLISNALKYRGAAPLHIRVFAQSAGTGWEVKIQDNGLGIAREYQPRIFVPFFRLTHRDTPGTGLGLAVCKKIVEGIGGTLSVESELSVGSVFTFTIPTGAAAPTLASGAVSQAPGCL